MGRLYIRLITATAWLLIFVAVLLPQRVNSFGVFELDLISFENSDGRDISGGCCSGLAGADGLCPGNCSVYLHFCITHYQVNVDMKSACTFFEFQTPLLDRHNDTYDVRNKERMTFDLNFSWPGQFSLIVEAWHPSKGYKELVEIFMTQRTLEVGPEWKSDTLRTTRSNLGLKYRIVCNINYYGPSCNKLCRPQDNTFGHYQCSEQGEKICLPGWGNKETDGYCLLALCNPECVNGNCSKVPNECRCSQGWSGPTCEICIRHPGCKHGKCETPYQCLCDEGWGGLMCDKDLNYCTNHKPCKNDGTCTNTGVGSYTCTCPSDFMGKDCADYKDRCRSVPCENGGTCLSTSDGQYTCQCPPGYFGENCETIASICKENQCTNGGTCIHDPEGFRCSCLPGYTGTHCEKIDTANCLLFPCLNGGTCVNSSISLNCMCPHGFIGARCENPLHCSSNSCQNGGTCIQQSDSIRCDCPLGFSGPHCQINHNKCSSNPCANGATCSNLLNNDYRCDCASGYAGKHCDLRDHCDSSPCMNGATCHVVLSEYNCRCLNGYAGKRCETVVSKDWSSQSISNVSHRISEEDNLEEDNNQVILITSLSASLIVLIVLLCCVVRCLLLHRRRVAENTPKTKEYDFDGEEERLQNERNAMHMNNKQCDMPQKIVNELDRVPPKLTNEAPPKVLNKEVGIKRIPDKSLVYATPRTFQKIDNMSGSSISCHLPQDFSPCSHGSIYVIEDHLRSHPEPGPGYRKKRHPGYRSLT